MLIFTTFKYYSTKKLYKMAEKKKEIIVKSNDTTGKVSPDVDTMLMQMAGLSSAKFITGKLKIKVVMEKSVIKENTFEMTGLSDEYKALGAKISESIIATLKGIPDGEIKVVYETKEEID